MYQIRFVTPKEGAEQGVEEQTGVSFGEASKAFLSKPPEERRRLAKAAITRVLFGGMHRR